MKIGISILLFALLSAGISFYCFNASSENQQNNVEAALNAKVSANELIVKSLIMKSSVEKYLITGNKNDLSAYMKHTIDTDKMFQKLLNTLTDINQKNLVFNAVMSFEIWKEEYVVKEIENRKKIANSKYTMTDVIDEVNKKESKGYFDVFRQQIASFIETEKVLLKDRQDKYNKLLKSSARISSREVAKNVKWVAHTHEVIIQANNLLIFAIDIETGMRGYLLTGKDEFLEPYSRGYKNFFKLLKELSKKVSDNKMQVSQLKTINNHMLEWDNKIVKKSINLRKEVGSLKLIDRVMKMAASNEGEKLFDEYKLQMDAFTSSL